MGFQTRKIFFIIILTSLSFFGWSAKSVSATSTLRGAAWWGNQYQFLYFSCLDDVIGDQFDAAGNLNAPPAPLGFHFYSLPCTDLVHQVVIGNDGNLSGAAWNRYKGLVSFGTGTPPDTSFRGNCSSTCASTNCLACYNETDQKVYGYGRVVTDNTWLKLDNLTTTTMIQSWNTAASSTLPGHTINPGDFVGYALSSTSSNSDLSFNCENENQSLIPCNSYKVKIYNIQVGYMSSPNWSYSDACAQGALNADLRWQVKSGSQSKYEVVVSTHNSFSTSTHDYICWSKVQQSSANHFQVPNSLNVTPAPDCPSLSYNTSYYWWLRLYDSDGTPSPWYQYGTVPGSDGNPTFTTYPHEFPSPFFSWSPYSGPSSILVGTTTNFTSNSKYYYYLSSSSSSLPQSCTTSTCQYYWATLNDDGAAIGATTSPTTTIIFTQATDTSVILSVTDSGGYVCSTSTTFTINYGLPLWHEVKAAN